ncbi:MAG TPA: hypothetical protein VFQ87_03090 [Bradyrhizobium sp.]|jgi:hypothetical protein|nr:hypothetical protein [Bradyrhizobium sp.]
MKDPPEMMIAKHYAGAAARDAGARHAIMILEKGDALIVGAWVPAAGIIKDMLRAALEQLDSGEAVHVTTGPGD